MSPTMDQPRRALRESERAKPTGRRRASTDSPALADPALPMTRAARRAAERQREHASGVGVDDASHAVDAERPAAAGPQPVQTAFEQTATVPEALAGEAPAGADLAGDDLATVQIPAVQPAPTEATAEPVAAAVTAAIPLQAAEVSSFPHHRPRQYSREPYAVLHKAASVRHMSQRMAMVAGALGLALTVGTVGHALDLPFFGSESKVTDASGGGAGDATAQTTASISGVPGGSSAASAVAASAGATPTAESSDVSQAAIVSGAPDTGASSSPAASGTPTVSLAPPVWVPSAAQPAAPGTPAAPAPVPAQPVPAQPVASGAASDNVPTTPPTSTPTATSTPRPTATPTPQPTATQAPSPAPQSSGQSALGSLLGTVKKVLK